MTEILEIYNVNRQKIGSEERKKVHKAGLWHRAFHCWIVSNEGNKQYLVFQLRSPTSSFPNLLDITAAGHFKKGETKNRIVREIKEELGINVAYDKLIYLGQRTEVIDFDDLRNREFQDVFILSFRELSRSVTVNDEVSGLFPIPLKHCLDLFSGKKKSLTIHGRLYDSSVNRWKNQRRKVSLKHFVPRQVNYYLTVSIMAKRLSEKIKPLSI